MLNELRTVVLNGPWGTSQLYRGTEPETAFRIYWTRRVFLIYVKDRMEIGFIQLIGSILVDAYGTFSQYVIRSKFET